MPDDLFWRGAFVCGSALIYWAGVLVQVARVRRQIGRSPNVRPRGPKEMLLWVGWFLVIAAWLIQPWLIGQIEGSLWLSLNRWFLGPIGLVAGIAFLIAGYAGTLWCYAVMGNTWRMGIDRQEKNRLVTQGPYRFVRHPIYAFQVMMLIGVGILLPTLLSLLVLGVDLLCVETKAADEESYLVTLYGEEYREYLLRTGRLFPRLLGKAL